MGRGKSDRTGEVGIRWDRGRVSERRWGRGVLIDVRVQDERKG